MKTHPSIVCGHMQHAYLLTDGTMNWPNSREGDMLRGAFNELTELTDPAKSTMCSGLLNPHPDCCATTLKRKLRKAQDQNEILKTIRDFAEFGTGTLWPDEVNNFAKSIIKMIDDDSKVLARIDYIRIIDAKTKN